MPRLARFLGLTAAFSTPFYILHAYSHTPGAGAYIRLLMWCPAVAALATVWWSGMDVRSLGWQWPARRIMLWSCAIPIAYLTVAYAVGALAGGGTYFNAHFLATARVAYAWQGLPAWAIVPLYLVVDGLSRMIANIATTLGEEIGWRGLLVPLLAERHGFIATSLISGVIWGLWHFPLIFINQPIDSSTFVGAGCFLIALTGVSFPMTWLRLRSGTVWSAAVFHAAHNSFNAIALALLTPSARTPWLMDETGIVMAIVGVALAVIWSVWATRGHPDIHPGAATRSNVS